MERRTQSRVDELEELDPADRAWLVERLVEYRDLLAYLHDS